MPTVKASEEELKLNYGVSDTAPMWSVFRRNINVRETYTKLIAFITHIDDAVKYATASDSHSDSVLTTCNYRVDGWRDNVVSYFGVRGLIAPDVKCISDVYGTTRADGLMYTPSPTPTSGNNNNDKEFDDVNPRSFSADAVYTLVTKHARLIAELAPKVLVDNTWNRTTARNATRANEFRYDVRTQACTHDYAGFAFIGGRWYVAERITNAAKDIVQAKGRRRFLYEFISANGSATNMIFRNGTSSSADESDTGNDADDKDNLWHGVTTSGADYTGAVTGSAFGAVFAADNLAVQRALQRGEHQTQQANDATTPSNIAILVFPLVMNVVPVALIADVNTIGMLLYTLLTDVLTAVPLAIKGVEVLLIGRRSNRAVVTRISGANADLNSDDANGQPVILKAAETWVAECGARGSFTATGVILLLVAIAFMVGGVLAEFWAKRYVARKKKAKLSNISHSSSSISGSSNGSGNGTPPLHWGPGDMALGTGTAMVGKSKPQYGAAASGIGSSNGGGGGNSGNGSDALVNSNAMMANDNIPPHSVGASSSHDGIALLAHHSLRQPPQHDYADGVTGAAVKAKTHGIGSGSTAAAAVGSKTGTAGSGLAGVHRPTGGNPAAAAGAGGAVTRTTGGALTIVAKKRGGLGSNSGDPSAGWARHHHDGGAAYEYGAVGAGNGVGGSLRGVGGVPGGVSLDTATAAAAAATTASSGSVPGSGSGGGWLKKKSRHSNSLSGSEGGALASGSGGGGASEQKQWRRLALVHRLSGAAGPNPTGEEQDATTKAGVGRDGGVVDPALAHLGVRSGDMGARGQEGESVSVESKGNSSVGGNLPTDVGIGARGTPPDAALLSKTKVSSSKASGRPGLLRSELKKRA